MTWFVGIRTKLPLYNFNQIRTHVSRAAKKVTEKQHETLRAGKTLETLQDPTRTKRFNMAKSLFPKFMRNYAARINDAPFSHVASFLIVHELSAVIPLFGLWGAFYYFDYVPLGIPHVIIDEGSKFIRKMAERNDWQTLAHAELGSRVILQGAAAYFAVKAALPFRLVFSLWAMPWFARRCVVPFNSLIARLSKKVFTKKNKP